MVPSLRDTIERSRHGERIEEKQFDLGTFKRVQPLILEYGIKYDRDRPKPKEAYLEVSRQAREELAGLGVRWRN